MKSRKPDEFFCNELFEVARFGNVVETKNGMSSVQHEKMKRQMAEKLDETVSTINMLVDKIRLKVSLVDPLNLMNYLTSMNTLIMINKLSEADFTNEENMQLRCVEYVQSVLVSTKLVYNEKEDNESTYGEIMKLTSELYSLLPMYYFQWSCKADIDHDYKLEEQEYIVSSQLMLQVRGTQYQEFRVPVLEALIKPHNEEIIEAYGITYNDIIAGLIKLEKNLSSGRIDAFAKLREHMDRMSVTLDEMPQGYVETGRELVMEAVGVNLFDIKKATNWPDVLISDLSYEIGEDESFFSKDQYNGWPISNLPIHRKPFIMINGISYCFDYYILFDYFYRSFQKVLVNRNSGGIDRWNEIQGHCCEDIVADIFADILPESIIYKSNHYPVGKKDNAENDILIVYKDAIFIVEVKAGAFTPTPAITDFSAHKESLKNLVEKAEKQCYRTKQYLESKSEVYFYKGDDLSEVSFSIRIGDYTQVYMLDVTVADFNDIAAQMEKVKISDSKEDIIALSLNDLWVYKEYFDSPLEFVHYISQRTRATRAKALSISDELDHLGLYIENNMYSLQTEKMESNTMAFFSGYREDLDAYFAQKHQGLQSQKPVQDRPQIFDKILEICQRKTKDVKVSRFTNFLLDMSGEAKELFSDGIYKLSNREKELGRMLPSICFGEISYFLTVNLPDIEHIAIEKQQNYIMATLAKNERPYCYRIEVFMGERSDLLDIQFELITQKDIPSDKRQELSEMGGYYAHTREQCFLIQNHKKKVYPNDQCPCGSGKKYKKCCGKNT